MKLTICFDNAAPITADLVDDDDLVTAEQLRRLWLTGSGQTVQLVCANATVDVDLAAVTAISITAVAR